MSRGLDRQDIYSDERDRHHFLELLSAGVDRFQVRLHAYVLMTNHFHLLLETPKGNLSEFMQWLKQAYSMWHNVRHDRVGPLFQGRFRSVPVEDAGWIFELSQYLHLNPLRLARFKLSRLERRRDALDENKPLSGKEATRRLRELRRYPWSSYRAYAGYVEPPSWLTTEAVLERAGGRHPRPAYRKRVMSRLTGDTDADTVERLRDAMAIGSESFRQFVKGKLGSAGREIAGHREARPRVPLETIIEATERELGEEVRKIKRGGMGRDLVLKAAWDMGGWRLKELGERMGGLDYVTVHLAIRRLERKMEKQSTLCALLTKIKRACLFKRPDP